jgi:GTP-binding protein HflX
MIDHDVLRHATKTYVLYPHTRDATARGINPEARLEEACGLAEAIHVTLCGKKWVNLKEIKPGTYIGSGVVEELSQTLQALDIKLVVVDAALSPIQQRNLEKQWQTKVIDRTGLILEIFGERAQTAEGRLQVELAALAYQRSRLVRSWTHLERQRGGLGFIGGPGESQLEIDRRLISERITRIEKDLEKVKNRRKLHRQSRQKIPYPIVALVGYTNAGKSTLFNALTRATVLAEDMLFATLDPTMRLLRLPSGREIILSDTVGFISDLPTLLIAAFRATLEEVLEADLVLHIRDLSNPNADAQRQDVYTVLEDLGLDQSSSHIQEVYNKCDLLDSDTLQDVRSDKSALCISALHGAGLDQLKKRMDDYFDLFAQIHTFVINPSQGQPLAWLHSHGTVIAQELNPGKAAVEIKVKLTAGDATRFVKKFPDLLPDPLQIFETGL